MTYPRAMLAFARVAWLPLLIVVAAYLAVFVLPARDDRR